MRDCINCGRPTSPCTVCGLCNYCRCECWKCEGCKKKYASPRGVLHENCGVCRKCCECRNAPKFLPDKKLNITETSHLGGKSLLTRLPRTIGVELEIADWKSLMGGSTTGRNIPNLRFTIAHDWSVKPSEQEMVVSPLRGDAVMVGMLELSRAATAAGVVLNESCALHVHVGAKDLSYWDLRRLLTVYGMLEGEIYSRLIVPHRTHMPSIHYCQMMTVPHLSEGCDRCERYDRQYPGQRRVPESLTTSLSRMWLATSTEDLKLCMLRMLYGIENPSNFPTTVSTRKGGHWEFCRYFGLNLHSWMHRMTVEFRMKEATVDPWEIVFWPLWCGWFVHAITRMSDGDAQGVKSLRHFTEGWMPGYFRPWLERHKL
jgi:Putative amidoligase enzyme